MTKRIATHLQKGISSYVPDMVFAADVVNGRTLVNFGAPATLDADGILAAKAITSTASTYTSADFASTIAAGTLSDELGKLDAPFGRCISMVGSGSAADAVITITGRDYLGTRVREAVTLSGSTTVFSNKAFKWVETFVIAAGANSTVTFNAGWSDRLGLPYKATALIDALDDGEAALNNDTPTYVMSSAWAPSISTAAGIASWTVPFDGYVIGFEGFVTTSIGSLAMNLAFTGASTLNTAVGVTGTSTTVGTKFGKMLPDAARVAVTKGSTITMINSTPTASGGADVSLIFSKARPTFTQGDATTATSLTKDPRGVYAPSIACNGTRTFSCVISVDQTDLHGIEQF